MTYIGRFAPSPSGPLHFGSLVAAVGSYLDAKSHQGKWLLRIEDLDPPRVVPGASDQILRTLDTFGFEWDDEVLYQSKRTEAYHSTLESLSHEGLIYPCHCSRKQITESAARQGQEGPIYPGTCREKALKDSDISPKTLRLMTSNLTISFQDSICGVINQQLQQDLGDFVIRRADGLIAYQLAVVVDDEYQGVSHIVRGADLLLSTPRQLYLQSLLNMVRPAYAHLPLVLDESGKKLSKQDHARPVDGDSPLNTLIAVMHFLNQPASRINPSSLSEFWGLAIESWNINNINI